MNYYFTILSSSALMLAFSHTFAANYYVEPNGNDANPGTSVAQPWKTITKANSTLRAGDTVYLRSGTYSGQTIQPARSGTASQRITYAAYGGETPMIKRVTTGLKLENKSYITIDGIDMDGEFIRVGVGWKGINSSSKVNIKIWAQLTNAHHNIIQNVDWKHASGWSGVDLSGGSSYNKILNSTFDFVGTYDDGTGDDPGDVFYWTDANNNLVEGNTFLHAGHTLLHIKSGRYNVIRNNTFDNDWSGLGWGDVGARCIELQGMTISGPAGGYSLFENNIVTGTGAASDDPTTMAMKLLGQGYVVRNNYFYDNNNDAIMSNNNGTSNHSPNTDHNRIYNNVFTRIGGAAWQVLFYTTAGGITLNDNIFKNNIAYKTRQSPSNAIHDAEVLFDNGGTDALLDNKVINNLFFKSAPGDSRVFAFFNGNGKSLTEYESIRPNNFSGNIQQDPVFVVSNPTKKEDFQLRPSSPAIDAGDYLTHTRSGGTGTTIPVDDPYYFIDGFGVIAGDLIKVGNNLPVRILSVDYEKRELMIDQLINWSNGDQVSLNFAGQRPDIGAFEFGINDNEPGSSILQPPLPPSNLQLSID